MTQSKFEIRLELTNPAFVENDDARPETAKILRQLADTISRHPYFENGLDILLYSRGVEVGYASVIHTVKVV